MVAHHEHHVIKIAPLPQLDNLETSSFANCSKSYGGKPSVEMVGHVVRDIVGRDIGVKIATGPEVLV